MVEADSRERIIRQKIICWMMPETARLACLVQQCNKAAVIREHDNWVIIGNEGLYRS